MSSLRERLEAAHGDDDWLDRELDNTGVFQMTLYNDAEGGFVAEVVCRELAKGPIGSLWSKAEGAGPSRKAAILNAVANAAKKGEQP